MKKGEFMGGWFPLSIGFMDDPEFRLLSPTEKPYFWHLVSEFNLRGEFYQSDLEIAVTLATSEKTIRRGRSKLIEMGLIKAIPGTITSRNQSLATRYPFIRYAKFDEEGFFAQMPRYTFNTMLHYLRKGRLQSGDVVVYVCLFYWFWRNRGEHLNRDRFFITKQGLQSLTNLKDAPTSVLRIYEAIVFSSGNHLFNYQDKHHRFIFRDWKWFADPDKDEQNRGIAEIYIEEIKELVAREKQNRQLKIQQTANMNLKNNSDNFLTQRVMNVFEHRYVSKYHKWPNQRGYEKLKDLIQTFGGDIIERAIYYYFVAAEVPNGSGAKTRTLGNFITNIDDILKLSGESTIA
jgi:hypothetical protein